MPTNCAPCPGNIKVTLELKLSKSLSLEDTAVSLCRTDDMNFDVANRLANLPVEGTNAEHLDTDTRNKEIAIGWKDIMVAVLIKII
mmetsp:Transcript_20507/g.29283  ORF Transcript_20507/g.29283 Transcript_20507/m.29283 type:complete len:86 (+) Transcript_20507:973-1230(+)